MMKQHALHRGRSDTCQWLGLEQIACGMPTNVGKIDQPFDTSSKAVTRASGVRPQPNRLCVAASVHTITHLHPKLGPQKE